MTSTTMMMAMAATESDPSISLPLLLGLSRSTGSSSSKKRKKHNNNNNNNQQQQHENDDENDDENDNAAENKPKASESELLPPQPHDNLTLPAKLHRLLSLPKYHYVLSWMSHGRSWKIVDEDAFAELVLSVYFHLDKDGSNNDKKEQDDDNVHVDGDGESSKSKDDNNNNNKGSMDMGMDVNNNNNNNNNLASSTPIRFHQELLQWGFQQIKNSNSHDFGSYHHADFLRGNEDLVSKMKCKTSDDMEGKEEEKGKDVGADVGAEKAASADPNNAQDEGKASSSQSSQPIQNSEEVSNFLAFTGTSDPRVAQTYLEMAGNHLEMAVSLFMDHGGAAAGGGGGGIGGDAGGVEGDNNDNDVDMEDILAGSLQDAIGVGSTTPGAGSKAKGNANAGNDDENDGGEEEPDFYALPPMPPLPADDEDKKKRDRGPLPAERIVESALREYQAFRTVRCALSRWIRQRKSTTTQSGQKNQGEKQAGASESGHNVSASLQVSSTPASLSLSAKDYHHGLSHFLFQSMLHSSLPVRRASVRMILHNLHLVQQRNHPHKHGSNGSSENDNCSGSNGSNNGLLNNLKSGGLQEVLIVLLHSLMFGEAPYQQQQQQHPQHQQHPMLTEQPQSQPWQSSMSMLIPRYKNQAEGGDPSLQIMAMLVSLVCDGGFSNLLVGEEVREIRSARQKATSNADIGTGAVSADPATASMTMTMAMAMTSTPKEDDVLASSLLRELSSHSIESFVASGGLRWACGSITRLVHLLVRSDGPDGTNEDRSMRSGSGGDVGSGAIGDESCAHRGSKWGGSAERTDDVFAETIQTRLLLLIDLVYRLVLFGSVPAAVDKNGSFTLTATSNTNINAGEGGEGGDDARESSKGNPKPSGAGNSGNEIGGDSASDRAAARASRRLRSRELYELLARSSENDLASGGATLSGMPLSSAARAVAAAGGGGETSRTAGLRQSLRSSLGHPAAMAGRSRIERRVVRGGNVPGCSLANLGGPDNSAGGAGGGSGGGGDVPSPGSAAVSEENRQRKEQRRSSLQRVHQLFWSSTLPAAAIGTPSSFNELTGNTVSNNAPSTTQSTHSNCENSNSTTQFGLTPLACLIASYEILRSRPPTLSTLSTNAQLRGMERGISILGRIVDPGAQNAVVVSEGELPWGLMGIMNDNEGGKSNADTSNDKTDGKKSNAKKRDRAASHDSAAGRLRSASNASSGRGARSTGSGTGNSPSVPTRRAKRPRAAGSSGVTSLLERLTRVDASIGDATSAGVTGDAPREGSSLFATRYRSAMESMLRSSPAGAAGVGVSGTGTSTLRGAAADRDGSLSRILASGGSRASRPGSSHTASTSHSPNASLQRSLLRARAVAAGDVEEWRILNEADVMDVADESNDNEGDAGDPFSEHEDTNDNNNEEDGEVEEGNDDNNNNDNSDEEDSEASEMEDIQDEDKSHDDDDEDEENEEGDTKNENDDEEGSNYIEETDDEDAATFDDEGQFDDAVINLDEINASTTSAGRDHHHHDHHNHHSHHHHHREQRNPHRHSLRGSRPGSSSSGGGGGGSGGLSQAELLMKKREREQAFLRAAMQVLAAQYPELPSGNSSNHTVENQLMKSGNRNNGNLVHRLHSIFSHPTILSSLPLLTSNAEQSLLKSLCNIVKPPRKPLNLKIFLRRAPTQEEFFRGSLSRNPIGLSSLKAGAGVSASGGGSGDGDRRSSSGGSNKNNEPLVSDLRLHIAKDLQMEDSAELLELLVANKILDMNLKLRVVQQVLWKKYVEENATSASSLVAGAGPSHQMISTGSGLSMIFSSTGMTRNRGSASGGAGGGSGSSTADDNAILASFPPMVVTYRLAGVDGEATEDKVEAEDLEDPEAPSGANATPDAIEKRMEKEFGVTRLICGTQSGRGVAVLLASVQGTINELLRRIRRDEVARRRQLMRSAGVAVEASASATIEDGNTTREQFAKSPPCAGLVLLRHCANLSDNRKKMLANRAPTLLLRILLDILNAMNRSSGVTSRGSRRRSSTFDFGSCRSSASDAMDVDVAGSNEPPASSRNKAASHHVEGNPSTEALQEIIEMLASDISAEITNESSSSSSLTASKKGMTASGSLLNLVGSNQDQNEQQQQGSGAGKEDEDRTLPLVLKSLHSTELSPPLRKVIAKLLPFLTYGQVSQSRELASYFLKYVDITKLGAAEASGEDEGMGNDNSDSILMNTFVEAAINLPPVSVCDNLRKELMRNGFVDKVRAFLLKDAPSKPPSWSPALYPKSASNKEMLDEKKAIDELNREEWRSYFARSGLSQAFRILTGLCSKHEATQLLLSDISTCSKGNALSGCPEDDSSLKLLTLCHWMEATSDNTSHSIKNPNGILAETLLDALKEDNDATSEKIGAVRKKTRDRKRELAEERRNRALVGMSAFGTLAGAAVVGTEAGKVGGSALMLSAQQRNAGAAGGGAGEESTTASENRSAFASLFSSLLGPTSSSSSQQRTTRASSAAATATAATTGSQPSPPKPQPSWMAEMEAMGDEETGVTCAVCQEGRTLQPSELLGLYAYMKKVTVATSQGGGKGDIDGTVLLMSLPTVFPESLMDDENVDILFTKARTAANALEGTSHALSAMSASTSSTSASITGSGSGGNGRNNYYITTVSAGNAIHCSCHKKAKTADRNHPKAPKSEWEGASLRNSRVTCNVILPLVSSKTSKVPLMAVETALADYNAIVANSLGARPKSMLWSCLHDVRFLLMRMAYGEALNADCGGGSSISNFLLVLYQLYSADMFATNAEHDYESVEVSRHAKGLSAGYLVGVDIVEGPEFDRMGGDVRSKRLERAVADAAPMATLCSILFYNNTNGDDGKEISTSSGAKTHDLSGSDETAGKAAAAITPSPSRQWEMYKSKFLAGLVRCAGHRHSLGVTDSGCVTSRGISTGRGKNVEKARSFADWSIGEDAHSAKSSRNNTMIEEYSQALRPMITLYAVFDQLSKEFMINNQDDEVTEESSERLADKLESCYKANGILELLRIAEVNDIFGNDVLCKYFEKGATS